MLDLKIQSMQDATRQRRLVILHELAVNPTDNKIRMFISLHEVAVLVAISFYVNDLHPFDRSIIKRKILKKYLISHNCSFQCPQTSENLASDDSC